jgi:hypothetical protein
MESVEMRRFINLFLPHFVIPAKAGIHHLLSKFQQPVLDPRLRGGDEVQLRRTSFDYKKFDMLVFRQSRATPRIF